MNVRLAPQALSEFLADTNYFLDESKRLLSYSKRPFLFNKKINQLFDMLNSRNSFGKGSIKRLDKQNFYPL